LLHAPGIALPINQFLPDTPAGILFFIPITGTDVFEEPAYLVFGLKYGLINIFGIPVNEYATQSNTTVLNADMLFCL
jgi:hypothetical protein